ncbi:MAG: FtsX-like permease family protein [Bacteroidetes bacterium]|nr:FtsX-like permease family protein [Bacteroidota bacterium]
MNSLNYILKSFILYRKQNLAVLLGCIISTAVLSGALMLGDSVRDSMQKIVSARLGKVEYVLQSNDHFVRAQLVKDVAARLAVKSSAVLMLSGVISAAESDRLINKASIIGIDDTFWQLNEKQMPPLNEDEVIISANTAEKLQLKVNDAIILKVEKLSVIPLHSPFGSEVSPFLSFRMKIKAIADDVNMGRFSLKNMQIAPFNIFVSREFLCKKLEINGMANALLFAALPGYKVSRHDIDTAIAANWRLKDIGIDLSTTDDKGNYELTSTGIFIPRAFSDPLLKQHKSMQCILSYLVNSISLNDKSTPYSFAVAIDPAQGDNELKENEIIINQWLADDLGAHQSDSLLLRYFSIDSLRNIREVSRYFRVKDIIPTGGNGINRSLMPKFPGFQKAVSCAEWNSQLTIDFKKIRSNDEQYWNDYRGTPKAVISMKIAQTIWHNSFGDYTAIRFNGSILGPSPSKAAIEKSILNSLHAADFRLAVTDIKAEAVNAAANGVDFGELFISLSFFVILAGLILTVMLYVLGLDARRQETDLLTALGFSKSRIISLLFAETVLAVLLGSIVGIVCGIGYNYLMLAAMNSVWNDIVRTPLMGISIHPMTLLTAFLCSFMISIITIAITALRRLKTTPFALMGNYSRFLPLLRPKRKGLAVAAVIGGIILTITLLAPGILKSGENNSLLFLLSATVFMLTAWGFISILISYRRKKHVAVENLYSLAIKNASRNSRRSLTVIVLLSLGVFVILITGANRKTFHQGGDTPQSGSGGYALWAETAVPLTLNLNSAKERHKAGFDNESLLKDVSFVQLLTTGGDDASCLNLNQVLMPAIIGVDPVLFDSRQAFAFERLKDGCDNQHPWLLLNASYGSDVIPAFADNTVITWSLKKNIGDTLTYITANNRKLYIVLAGGLQPSVFQGNILIADKYFKRYFPSVNGSKLMLVDVAANRNAALQQYLSSSFRDYGMDISSCNERLSSFNSVNNTYLTVFMILAGLGLLIACLGIGIILYRNMLDRRQEIALMLALGFGRKKIFRLILSENIFLLCCGIITGLAASFIGLLPSLLSGNYYSRDMLFVIVLLIVIILHALLWIYLPVRTLMKQQLIPALRNE